MGEDHGERRGAALHGLELQDGGNAAKRRIGQRRARRHFGCRCLLAPLA